MVNESIFTGKKIKLLKKHFEVGNILLSETGEVKDGEGNVLEFGKDYILVQGEIGDNFTRVYDANDQLLCQFEIKP